LDTPLPSKCHKGVEDVSNQDLAIRVTAEINQSQMIKSLSESIRDIENKIKIKIDVDNSQVKEASNDITSLGEKIRASLGKFVKGFGTAQAALFLKDGISFVNQLNKSLTELSIVYMKSQNAISEYSTTFKKMGIEFGVATQEIARDAVELARHGLSENNMMDKLESAIKYAKISNIDFTTSAQVLGSTVNSMNVDIERASDVFSYLGDSTRMSADQLGIAMQKIGDTARNVGVGFEKINSWIAAVSIQTQEGADTVAQSMQSIFARMHSLQKYGFSEDGTRAIQVVHALAEVGIKLIDSRNNFRNFGTVMDELGSKWSTLTKEQQSHIAATVAGISQQSKFVNLMEGYGESLKIYEGALNSAGTTQKRFDLYQEGTEAKLNSLKNAWAGVWQSSFDSGSIQVAIDMLTSLAMGVNRVTDTFGVLPTIMGVVTASVMLFSKSGLTPLYTMLTTIPVKLSLLKLELRSVAATSGITAAAVRGLGTALTAVGRFVLPIAAISAVTWAVTELLGANSKLTDSFDDSNMKYQELSAELLNVQSFYDKNHKSISSDISVKEQLFSMQNKLIDTFGKEADGLDLVNGKYDEQMAKLDRLNGKILDDKIKDNQIAVDAIREKKYGAPHVALDFGSRGFFRLVNNDLLGKNKSYHIGDFAGFDERLQVGVEEYYKQLELIYKQVQNRNINIFSKDSVPKNYEEWNSALQGVKERMEEVKPLIDQINDLEDAKKDKIRLSVLEQSKFNIEQKNTFDQINSIIKKQPESGYAESIKGVANIIENIKGDNLDNVIEQIKQLPQIVNNKDIITGLTDFQNALNDSSKQSKIFGDNTGVIPGIIDNATKALRPLNQALNEVSKGHSLSSNAVGELITQYPDLLDKLTKTKNGWHIEAEEINNRREAVIQAQIDSLEAETKITDTTLDELTTRLALYGIEMNKIKDLNDAKKAAAGLKASVQGVAPPKNEMHYLSQEAQDYFNNKSKTVADLLSLTKEDISTAQRTAELKKKLRNLLLDNPRDKSKNSNSNEDKPEIRDITKEHINAINLEAEKQKKLNDDLKEKADRAKSEKDYQTAIKYSTKLITDQLQEVNLLTAANIQLKDEMDKLQKDNSKYRMFRWLDKNGEASEAFINLYNGLKSKTSQEQLQKLFNKYQAYAQAILTNNNSIRNVLRSTDETQSNLDNTKLENTKAYLEHRGKLLADFDKKLSHSQKVQQLYNEGTMEFNAEQENQLKILGDKAEFVKKEIQWTEIRLKQGNLTKDQIKELNQYLQENKEILLDITLAQNESSRKREDAIKQWKSEVTDTAREAMRVLENYYKKQGELAKEALDKELNEYKSYIDERKNLLQRENANEDFNASRDKLQNEEIEIKKKINEISLDDSVEGKVKQEELEKQLADKLEEIRKLELDRTRDLRSQNFDDLLVEKEREIAAERSAAEKKWQGDLAADVIYSALKEAVLQNNVSNMESILKTFAANVSNYMDEVGKSIDTNLIEKMEMRGSFDTIVDKITKLPSEPPKSTSQGQASTHNGYYTPTADEQTKIDVMKSNSIRWYASSSAERTKLEKENKLLGESIGAEYNSKSGVWTKGGLRLYHNGGEVGGNKASFADWLHGKLNLKSDEVVSILKNGEFVLRNNPLTNFVSNIKFPVISSIFNTNNVTSPSSLSFEKLIHIDKVEKDVDIDNLMTRIDNKFRSFGFNMG